MRALEDALASDKKIFLATQHDASVDEPRPDEIYAVGTVANIVQSLRLPDGNIKVLVEGVERGKIVSVSEEEGFFRAVIKTFHFKVEAGSQLEALTTRVTSLFEQYVKLSQNLNYETMIAAIRVDEPGKLADTVGVAVVLILAVSAVVAYLFARGFAGPLGELAEGARRLAAGDLGHKIRVVGGKEHADLAATFNAMSGRLADTFARVEHEGFAPSALHSALHRARICVTMDRVKRSRR